MAKFVVTKEPYGNEYEVKLHYETKDKIKKIFAYGGIVAVTAVLVARIRKDHENPTTTPED